MSTNKQDHRLRFLPAHTRATLRAVLEGVVTEAMDNVAPVQRSCVSCRQFDDIGEQCKLAGARPPARVIAFGCASFDHDDVPF